MSPASADTGRKLMLNFFTYMNMWSFNSPTSGNYLGLLLQAEPAMAATSQRAKGEGGSSQLATI